MASPPPSQRTAEARAAFLASLHSIGSHGDAELQARAKDIHTSSAALMKQEAELAKQTDLLAKQTNAFQKMAEESRGQLKEIGDVQNWAELLERDLQVLEETMTVVDEEEIVDKKGATGAPGSGKKRRWF